MGIFKTDAASLILLGDDNWLSINLFFDLVGRHGVQFMLEQQTPLAQQRASRYIRHLHGKYISTYLRLYDGGLNDIPVRQIVQAEDCPRDIKSVGWQSQRSWDGICLIPDPYYFMERGYENFIPDGIDLPDWATRRPTVFWRGSTTGVIEGADLYANGFGIGTLDRLPRYRMCRILQDLGGGADVGIVAIVQCPDVEKDAVVARLSSERLLTQYVGPQDMVQYKFLLDIDGNASSWNMVQRLRLGCCILKVESSWVQWFSHRIEPWVHYVPVKTDLSDLLEKVEWCRTHDPEAQRIAENGRRFGLSMRYEVEMQGAALDFIRTSRPLSGDAEDIATLRRISASADRLRPAWDTAIRAWSSFPNPVRLQTIHGTILGCDDRGALIQLPSGGDLANAITLFDGNGDRSEKLREFHIDRDGDTVSLERGGLFLSAEPDHATMICNRLEKGEWETFKLVSVNC